VSETIHATALVVDGIGILLRGPSGAGKSHLALALLSHPAPRFARLIADDRVILNAHNGRLIARAPHTIHGCLEVRGVGIVHVPTIDAARIHIIIDRVAGERMPPDDASDILFSVVLRRFCLSSDLPDPVASVFTAMAQLRMSEKFPLASQHSSSHTVRPSDAQAS
jgi:HPr kinase/phosphorylase